MKKLLVYLSTGLLTATTISAVVVNKTTEVNQNKIVEQHQDEINQLVHEISAKSFYQTEKPIAKTNNNLKDGKNDFKYYFAYSNLFLNHSTLNYIQNALGAGVGAVGAILSELGIPFAGIIAAILIAQWYIWDIPSYDQGNGVEIQLIQPIPTIIVGVWAQ
ncbi:hypothetical protein SSYRP_v1c01520 [Spiroplasma syrphidicola EA-1]|uniref:Transmembrane protein n=1 Tax=Spiroplasma syrphidicola EA-1 TaxID=1276229 RepID=R4U595_9MOLU|nr:hypothetical protein [Spiroplasma syrphidicola]AGM25748.1 hypothetical protein SSYRP_v1c01520 [Spiroplasma syrphidicola EA-1]